jgi:uncharacterized membrane protein YczE
MLFKRYTRLIIGLFFYSVGIVFTIHANLGLAPWDALHSGLSQMFGIPFGQMGILVGLIILVATYQLKESIGIGTITNIVVIGFLIDYIFYIELIPIAQTLLSGILMLVIGMVLIAIASYCYISSAFGTGPRDALMSSLTRVTQKPVGLIRGLIEISVLFIGYLLGAKIGLGTFIIAFGIGPIIQIVFSLFNFNVDKVNHDFLLQKK